MTCCSEKAKMLTAYNVGGLFLILGIVIVSFWSMLYSQLLHKELVVTNSSNSFKMWKETPVPMYLRIHLFNWTNAAEVTKDWSIKPHYQECGPYVFSEHHIRFNFEWRDDGTVVFQQKRVWHFRPEMSAGSLDDRITNINVIATVIANFVKKWNPVLKIPVNLALNKAEKTLAITRTAKQWMFDGFPDELLTIAKEFNISKLNMDKFGWFYGRNNSETYDGNFTMYTGETDMELIGVLEEWKGHRSTMNYKSYCGYVNGTTGELWPPVKGYKSVFLFLNDICGTLKLFENGTDSRVGIEGTKFIGTDFNFDNGTKYPSQQCFQGKQQLPTGVRDVSKCQFGAPAYISYPHFYLADPWYNENIAGLKPNASVHTFSMLLEPTSGVPLNAAAKMQVNLLLEPISGLTLFKNVKKVMLPMLWIAVTSDLTQELGDQVKVLLIVPSIGMYSGYGLISVGTLILAISIYLTFKGAWKDTEKTHLLPERSL